MGLFTKRSFLCFTVVLIIFMIFSLTTFDNVNKTGTVVVDEEFHLPMGLAYCKYNFSVWDPKITTLPGLYLISAIFLGPFQACTIYWIRFISLGAAMLNIPLLYILFSKNDKSSEWNNILSAVTTGLIPPVYFFSHFYYTDIVSLTVILLMFVMYHYKCHYMSSFFGFFAVLCRQTNIMWVFYLLGQYIFTQLYILTNKNGKTNKGVPVKNMQELIKVLAFQPKAVLKSLTWQFILDCSCYLSIICAFVVFIVINGGIVVGDKSAHEAGIHIPHLFYFSLFCLLFAWPHFVCELSNFLAYVKNHKKYMLIIFILCLIAVHFNTVVHPYLLADNRHYTFYIWNRFYGRYPSFRYTIVPLYIFSWYVICKAMIIQKDISTLFIYLTAVICLLVPQKLIDVRYYFVPYIIFRLNLKNNSYTVFNLILEFVTYVIMNVLTFNLFFTKQIFWSDYDQPQRLIW